METSAVSRLGLGLRGGGPARVVEGMRQYLAGRLGVRKARLLLADYRMSGLSPVPDDGERSAVSLTDTSAASRCFASQRLLLDEDPAGVCNALVPVSAWGDRVGVLVAELPGPPDEETFAELTRVADELAVTLIAADRFTDRYRQARRRRRMTMAAEMQWDMLPGRSLSGPAFGLAGQLEPAYEVCGDHFDWTVTDDRLHLSTLLLEIDLTGGRVTVIDAGSPRAIRLRGGQTALVELEHQLPLGMFPEARYAGQDIDVEPGDRLFIVSDGVHAAAPGGRLSYGDRGLLAAIRATRLQHRRRPWPR
jgi:hypothetical protein